MGMLDRFSRYVTHALRVSTLFMAGFTALYYLYVGLRVAFLGYAEVYALAGELLLGVSIIALLVVLYLLTETIVKFIAGIANLAYWWFVPSNWIIDPLDPTSVTNEGKSSIVANFPILQVVMYTVWFILAAIAVIGIVNFVVELSSPAELERVRQHRLARPAIVAVCLLGGACVPGVLMLTGAYAPMVTIEPKGYQIRFNFWVHEPNITLYNETWLDELDVHAANLDIGTADPAVLLQWEARCPNITYRNIINGWGATDITDNAKAVIATMIAYEGNGTLDGWRGVCFDFEGDNFEFNASHDTIEGAAQAWIEFFDWVDAEEVANRSGEDISLECISAHAQAVDVPFDGDLDLQTEAMHLAYYPLNRWTTYAPMIYRCEYREDQEKPYGSVVPGDPFNSAYEFYCDLHQVARAVGPGQRGAYVGMTNCSCYGRDLDQWEYFSWGQKGGLWNLARDVLICKHFELPEVTFFLLYTAIENGYSMGGVFESYSPNFLTWMNETVNGPGAPTSFQIQYVAGERNGIGASQYDWMYDANRPEGISTLAAVLAAAIVVEVLVQRRAGKPGPIASNRGSP
ncbi:MAG: hypothetical protein JW839_19450 [Candidatus Lokiarchaeota archaeon]|nr:hypothetical protein [Candidatus Lokiarchaeota archaeon]